MTEISVAHLPPEGVYRSLMEYFTRQRGVKVKRCLESSYIEVELTRPEGCAKIEMTARQGGSEVKLNFNFTKPAFTKPGFHNVRFALYARVVLPIFLCMVGFWRFLPGILVSALMCLALGVVVITEARLKQGGKEFKGKVTNFLRELQPTRGD